MEAAKPKKHPRWVYILPVLHLSACLFSMVGYVIPSLQFLGIVWVFVMLIDLPVSSIAYALAWRYSMIGGIWIVVVGTLWWYLISLGIEKLTNRLRVKAHPDSHLHSSQKS